MTERSVRAIMVGIIVLVLLVGGFLYYSKHQGASNAIASFTECEAAGYQVVNTIPPECVTPDGKVFVDNSVTNPLSTSTNGTTGDGTRPSTGGSSTSTSTSTATSTMSDRIRVSSLSANQLITSPLVVSGQARGSWYFEASFPVELYDGNGKRIAMVPAQAQGDWMTTNFVPFKATLSFSKPTTATGTLILKNDNPSGLPQNALELRIPVRFSSSTPVATKQR